MKLLRFTGILLLLVLGIITILAIALPASQEVEKSVTIRAPAHRVYNHLRMLENFNRWATWNREDSSVRHELTGTDGTLGAETAWSGDPEISGKGKITIHKLEENREVGHSIEFLEPRPGKAGSSFLLEEKNGFTTVTWLFHKNTPRPWNIFNLFYNMEEELGPSFSEGLSLLKKEIEKDTGLAEEKKYDIRPMNFPATEYALVRQEVRMGDISSFFATHLALVRTALTEVHAAPGVPTGLYFSWDEKNQLTDMAAAMPAEPGKKPQHELVRVVGIPASKAVFLDHYGPYDQLSGAHTAVDAYLRENKLDQKFPVIEQYITDPGLEKDSTKWHTRLIILVE